MPVEIEALDPSRNLSRLRMLGATWNGIYFPGHLLGDQGFAAFRETAVKLSPHSSDVALQVKAVKPFSRGVRIELEEGIAALITEAEACDIRNGSVVRVQIPAAEIVFLSK